MRQTMGITLFCREQKIGRDGKAPVEVTITTGGKKASFQLPDRFVPSDFRRMRDSNRTNEVVKLCSEVKVRLINLKDRHPDSDSVTLKDYYLNGDPSEGLLKKRVLVRDLCDAYLSEIVKGTPSYDKYKVTFKRLKEVYGSRRADSVTTGDISSFLHDLKRNESFADGTLRNYKKRLKSLFAYGCRKKVLVEDPTLKLRMAFADKDPVFLTMQELARIQHADLGSPCLERVRDAFLFMCGCGLEYSDVKNLSPEDVKTTGGILYIHKPRIKTGIFYTAPLVAEAPSIWQKYSGHIPLPANQVFNRFLKVIATTAGIDKRVSTLTARHTYSTLLISGNLGTMVPAEVLMKCLGHSNVKQSLLYGSLTQDVIFKLFSKIVGSSEIRW